MAPAGALLPPGVDSAAWSGLNEAVKKQASPRAARWQTHSRLASALAEAAQVKKGGAELVLAHDCLVLPWLAGDGTWRNLPHGAEPCCVKKFACVPSLEIFQAYEAGLSPTQRIFYECLRERTPCRYWLDLDLTALSALQLQLDAPSAHACRDALACMLERHIVDAVLQLFMVARPELKLLLVDGNGDHPAQRVSLHAIVHGALLPDNEHAAAAVRLAVVERLKARGGDGSDATAAALLRCVQVEAVVDRVNTKNRLRRLTGHTKIGQGRHSKPLTCCDPLPPGAYFVSGAAAGGRERVLSWRADAFPRALPPAAQPLALAQRTRTGGNATAQPQVAAVEAECRAISELHGAMIDRILPPSLKFPCWTAFTLCRACPWRANDSPEAARAAGPVHRSARLYVVFFRDRLELGCTAPRHAQRAARPYAHAASQRALFPDAAGQHAAPLSSDAALGELEALLGLTQQMEISPEREAPAQQENVSPFLLAHMGDIFSPRFAGQVGPWRLNTDDEGNG